MNGAICSIPRGCGKRVKGGVYWETGLSKDAKSGSPLEEFIQDPPAPVNVVALGLSPIGVKLIEHGGAWHVFDWIGSQHYPNAADIIEETRRFGLSRRLPKTLEFGKLTADSRIILVHARGWVSNPELFCLPHGPTPGQLIVCPKELPRHSSAAQLTASTTGGDLPCCAGFWWHDIQDGVPVGEDSRQVMRKMPWGEYPGRLSPDGEARYMPAVIARFPLTRIAVVKDDDGAHEAAAEAVQKAGHDPVIVDE